jgi:hypothetical protein
MPSVARALRAFFRSLMSATVAILWVCHAAHAAPKADSYWKVDDVRPGMKGVGKTVLKGTKLEEFQAEVLGVLRNGSPGRDLVLCRLSGANLEQTGVIAGMSGSPVYLEGKLLGAVAYAWAYGKEPIAGITPFAQMHGFVEAYERRDLAEQGKPTRVGLREPLRIGGRDYDTVTVSQRFDTPTPGAQAPGSPDELWLTPLQTPLAATGFTPNVLRLLRDRTGPTHGLVPMQGGGTTAKIAEEAQDAAIVPGGSLAISLIQGDFDLSGIGTVTHVEGDRVYGWGHPFMGLGSCQFPLMTGYIHTVYPRQTVSFKMGSPLKCVGVINADVSTCIAGWLGRKPDLLPVRMAVTLDKNPTRTFNVQIARQRSLLANLVFASLTNSVDMEGELPEELTARLKVQIELKDRAPIILEDTFAGFSGGRAPQALYAQVAALVQALTYNPYDPIEITRIESTTQISPGRRTADIESVEPVSETYAPGETVQVNAFVRPFRSGTRRVPLSLKLPPDLPEGHYTLTVTDEFSSARQAVRDNPTLSSPQNVEQVLEAVQVQTAARRTNLVLRLPLGATGVAVEGKALPDLPASMVQILSGARRTGSQTMQSALVSKQATEWVIQGSETVRIHVTRNRKVMRD